MQVFWPRIELQKFPPESNLLRACVLFTVTFVVFKSFTSDAKTRARVLISLWKRPWHKNKWSKHKRKPIKLLPFVVLALVLASTFSCENETGSWRLKNVVELYFLPTTQSTRFGFVCGFTKNAEAEGSLKKGFQKLCVCSLFFMMVPLSLDTRSLCLFLYLFIIPALIRVSWPHQIFFGVNFSCFS